MVSNGIIMKFERMWVKDFVIPDLRYCPTVCVEDLMKIQGDTKEREILKCVVVAMYSWQHCGTGTLSYR